MLSQLECRIDKTNSSFDNRKAQWKHNFKKYVYLSSRHRTFMLAIRVFLPQFTNLSLSSNIYPGYTIVWCEDISKIWSVLLPYSCLSHFCFSVLVHFRFSLYVGCNALLMFPSVIYLCLLNLNNWNFFPWKLSGPSNSWICSAVKKGFCFKMFTIFSDVCQSSKLSSFS